MIWRSCVPKIRARRFGKRSEGVFVAPMPESISSHGPGQELSSSKRHVTCSLAGILASKVTKVNRAAWARAHRYASVHRFGELNGPSVNASHVSGSSFGSARQADSPVQSQGAISLPRFVPAS